MESTSKPTFSANTSGNSDKPLRKESGVIWDREAKSSGMKFFSIKMKFTKEQLAQLTGEVDAEGVVEAKFVAFPNKYKEAGDNKPSFRIYEEKKLEA